MTTSKQLKVFDKITDILAHQKANGHRPKVKAACEKAKLSSSYFYRIKRNVLEFDSERAALWESLIGDEPMGSKKKATKKVKLRAKPIKVSQVSFTDDGVNAPEKVEAVWNAVYPDSAKKRVIALIGDPRDIAEALRGF